MQPAPQQQQQQEAQAGGGQVSSTDVQAILQQLQRTQNGGQLATVPLSQITSEFCTEDLKNCMQALWPNNIHDKSCKATWVQSGTC